MTTIGPAAAPQITPSSCVPSAPQPAAGPTGTVKVGTENYDVRNGDVFVAGKNVGKIDDSGNFEVNGQKGNVNNVAGAVWNGNLSSGQHVDNRPSGIVQAGNDTFEVRSGEVFQGGSRVGTIDDAGRYNVTLHGQAQSGNITDNPDIGYAGVKSDGTQVSYRLAPGGGGLVTCAGPGGANDCAPNGVAQPITCMGPGGVTTGSGLASRSGADLALTAQRFFETNQFKPSYQAATWNFDGAPNKALAAQVKSDAATYLASNPELASAAERMIHALGPNLHPAKVDGWKTDLALAHYAQEGRAAGAAWGSSKSAVDAMLDAPPASPPWAKGMTPAGPLVTYGTEGRSGVNVAAPVAGGQLTVMTADGKNNTIDFCTNPYPSPTGVGDAILGGTNNKGQVDLVGTVVVRAGEGNTWTVKDPSQRPALNSRSTSEYGTEVKRQLEANALNSRVVLEGNAADWSVRVSKDSATYTNERTGTTVTLPAEHQARIAYMEGTRFETLANDVAQGRSIVKLPHGGEPRTAPTPDAPTTTTSPATGSTGTSPVTAPPERTGSVDVDAIEELLTELLTDMLTEELSKELLKSMLETVDGENAAKTDGKKRKPGQVGKLKSLLMKKAGLTSKQATRVLDLLGLKEERPMTARSLRPHFTA